MFGFFALPLIPAFMELGVEVTYPVSEVISSGLLWSSAYVQSDTLNMQMLNVATPNIA
jgi:hypothetical protein